MKSKSVATIAIILVLALIVLASSVYVVDEREQVVITRFGKAKKGVKEAGIHFKSPFIDKVVRFDKQILEWDGDATQIPTRDKKFIWIDTWARWKIEDPVKFLQTRRTEAGGHAILDQFVETAVRDVISSQLLIDVVRDTKRELIYEESAELGKEKRESISESGGRSQIVKRIFQRAVERKSEDANDTIRLSDYGMKLIDVRIKHINYIEDVRRSVYEQMISEREKIVAKYKSEAQAEKAKILGDMQKELDEINSKGYRDAEAIRGEADAEVLRVYAEAYSRSPEFYSFMRTLETYKNVFDENTELILTLEGDFFKYLKGYSAVRDDADNPEAVRSQIEQRGAGEKQGRTDASDNQKQAEPEGDK